MKKLFTLLAISVSISAIAQPWYIKPTVGMGRTGFSSGLRSKSEKNIFFKGEVAAGIELDKLRIETGLGYVNPGYQLNGLTFEDSFDPTNGQVKYYTNIAYKYNYAYLPLRVAYKIKLAGGLSVIPAAGIAPTYNVSSDVRVTTSTGVPSPFVFTKSKVNRFGALADALLYAEYNIGTLSVTAGGSYKHMVNPIFKNGGERLHFLSGDAGILYHF